MYSDTRTSSLVFENVVFDNNKNFKIGNNIFYGNVNNEFVLSGVTFSDNSSSGTTMNNNFYYQEYPDQRMVTINSARESYKMSNWYEYLPKT